MHAKEIKFGMQLIKLKQKQKKSLRKVLDIINKKTDNFKRKNRKKKKQKTV